METITEGGFTEMSDDINDITIETLEEKRHILSSVSMELDRVVEEYVSPRKIHYLEDLRDLRGKCLSYKKAHSDCKSVHFMYDKIIKLTTLFLSSITTYYISSHTGTELNPEDLDIDRKLTFATTFVSGVNAIFNFSEKIEIHKGLNSEYIDLYNDIEETIRLFTEKTNEENIKAIFQGYHKKFKELNKKTSEIGIMKYIKNKHCTA